MRKTLSIILALTMILSMLSAVSISVSAEETVLQNETKIYFEVPDDWIDYTSIYCFVCEYESRTGLMNWGSKKGGCTLEEDGRYSYDLSKVGGLSESMTYLVVFYCDNGNQTHELLMHTGCYGDTVYCTGVKYDDNYNSYEAFWRNQDPATNGPILTITKDGTVMGKYLPEGVTEKDLFITFLNNDFDYAQQYSGKTDQQIIDDIAEGLNMSEEEVFELLKGIDFYIDWVDSKGRSPFDIDTETEYSYLDFKYKLNDDDTAFITEYLGTADEVEIPSTLNGLKVTAIGSIAFSDSPTLRSVTIPDTVITIQDSAFSGCENLKVLNIPASVENLYLSFFDTSFTQINVDKDNKYLSSIDGVLFDKQATTLIKYPTCNPNTSYSIPNSVTELDPNSFFNNEILESVVIPGSIKTIREYLFMGCTKLENIVISSGVERIGPGAFQDCDSLKVINIPDTVNYINKTTFSLCNALEEINVDAENEYFSSTDGVLFSKEYSSVVRYPAGKKDKIYVIPDGITVIGHDAFYDCVFLESIVFADSITSVSRSSFDNCTSLKTIILSKNLSEIPDYAFAGCNALEEIIIPGNVKSIGAGAFENCTSLDSVVIEDGVTYIGTNAFGNCLSLKTITIPNSVTQIDPFAFGYVVGEYDEKIENFTVFGTSDSAAESYADEHGFSFVSLSDSSTVMSDAATNITVTANAAASLVVLEKGMDDIESANILTGNVLDIQKLYDISLVRDDSNVQPNGYAKVAIPCDNEALMVYRIEEDGTVTNMDATYEDGYLIFYTDHFSLYAVADTNTILGDANGDLVVNIKDATLIQKSVAKVCTLTEDAVIASDANGDSVVNIKDATAIQKFVAKIPTGYEIGEVINTQ